MKSRRKARNNITEARNRLHFNPRLVRSVRASCSGSGRLSLRLNTLLTHGLCCLKVASHCDTSRCKQFKLYHFPCLSLLCAVKSQVLTPLIQSTPSQDSTNTTAPFPCKPKTCLPEKYLTSAPSTSLPFPYTSSRKYAPVWIGSSSNLSGFKLLVGRRALFSCHRHVCLNPLSGFPEPVPWLILYSCPHQLLWI